jgi:phosphatidylglycerophosphatase A
VDVNAISAAMVASFFAGWEILLILAVVVILLGPKYLPPRFRQGLKKGFDEFRKASDDVVHELRGVDPGNSPDQSHRRVGMSFVLWLAQGFGVGRIPFAPGTFGSLVGLLWFALLLRTGNLWLYVAGTVCGLALAVWLCGTAEKILKQSDPSSVVLDEIAALPLCFLPWVASAWFRDGPLPALEIFLVHGWIQTAILFVLFRLFDVLKPWPLRQSQRLPGGWGVTIDDVLAAAYVALISLPFVF